MVFKEKIEWLRKQIYDNIAPLIKGDFVLLDLPYYLNVGDNLIWAGERQFLNSLPGKCLFGSSPTYDFPNIKNDVTICLQGGGNFGDLYKDQPEFRRRVILNYPDNPIVLFPQSTSYSNQCNIDMDVEIYGAHRNLTLCARDKVSYDFLLSHFSNNIVLAPDMAFYISDELLDRYRGKYKKDTVLYMKRKDKEATDIDECRIPDCADIRDWPSFENKPISFNILYKLLALRFRLRNMPILSKSSAFIYDMYASAIFHRSLIHQGMAFMSEYENIITTRLHGMILSILLYKHTQYVDNTTGKLSAFVDTWLSDLDGLIKWEQEK